MNDIQPYLDDLEEIRRTTGPERGSNSIYLKMMDGDNRVRILPYRDWETGERCYEKCAQHYLGGDSGRAIVGCPKAFDGSPCPLCQMVTRLSGRGKEEPHYVWIKRHQATPRFYFLVLDKNGEETLNEIKIWNAAQSAATQLLQFQVDPEWGALDHPETGGVVTINKGPTSETNPIIKYIVRPSPRPDPLQPEVLQRVEKFDIRKFVRPPKQEVIQELLAKVAPGKIE